MLKAQDLFSQQKYRPALDLLTDVSAPPKRVVSLYPKSIAGHLSTVEEPVELTDSEDPSGETSAAEENSSQPEEQIKTIRGQRRFRHSINSIFPYHKRSAPREASERRATDWR